MGITKEAAPSTAQAPVQPSASTPPERTAQLSVSPSTPKSGETVLLTISSEAPYDIYALQINLDDQGSKIGKCESVETQPNQRYKVFLCQGKTCSTEWQIKCTSEGTYSFQGFATVKPPASSSYEYTNTNIVSLTIK